MRSIKYIGPLERRASLVVGDVAIVVADVARVIELEPAQSGSMSNTSEHPRKSPCHGTNFDTYLYVNPGQITERVCRRGGQLRHWTGL